MDAESYKGRWTLIEAEVLPNFEDDGGFHDQGMGYKPELEGELARSFVEFLDDGTWRGHHYGEIGGTWKVQGDTLEALYVGDDLGFSVADGLLQRTDHDEEHGRDTLLTYERESKRAAAETPEEVAEAKLTKKAQQELDRLWDSYVECDYLDLKKLRKLNQQHGPAAGAYLQKTHNLLSCTIQSGDFEAATMLLEGGADPNVPALSWENGRPDVEIHTPNLTLAREHQGEAAEALVALLLSRGATE